MNKKNILLIGSGRRAQSVILPALYCLKDSFDLTAIYSRSIKNLSMCNDSWKLTTINDLGKIDFTKLDLIIIAVTLDAVPEILQKLSSYPVEHITLMIDTPVLPHNKLGAIKYFSSFKKVLISEDSIALPQYVLAKRLMNEGRIGLLRCIYLWHSGYKFHALASIKYLTGASYIKSIRSRNLGNGIFEKTIKLSNGVIVHVLEPRDYSVGRFLIIGESGLIADYPLLGHNSYYIDCVEKNNIYRGLMLNNILQPEDSLDKIYSDNIPGDLSERNLRTSLKVRGFMSLVTAAGEENSLYRYEPIAGLYDMLAIKIADKFGYFRDFPLGVNNSIFGLLLKTLSPFL